MQFIDQVYWQTLKRPEISKPTQGGKSDVVVVGGGMTGIMAALSFAKRGKLVTLVEKDYLGAGASGKSSGFVTPDSELELSALLRTYGPQKAKPIWEFSTKGVDIIRNAIEDYEIDCDYQIQDSLFVANTEGGTKKIQAEYEARRKLNYPSTLHGKAELRSMIGSEGYFAGVRYAETFGINSYLFCQGMKDVLQDAGVLIYENTRITDLDNNGAHAGELLFTAEAIIFCGDRFIPELRRQEKNIYHGQTFLCASKQLSPEQVKTIFPGDKFMVWDTDLVYQYYRITGENRLLIGGSNILLTYANDEKHNAEVIFKKLGDYVQQKFPTAHIQLEYMWPGLIGVTKDFLPILDQDKHLPHLYYVGAGAGLPYSAAIGDYVAAKILDGRSDFDEYLRGSRFGFSNAVQNLLGKQLAFAIFQGINKL